MGWALVVAVCVSVPWATRGLLLYEKRLVPSLADLRGLFADGSVGLAVAAAVGVILLPRRRWSRALAWLVLAAFVVATFGIYEVVSAFDSLHALAHLHYLTDRTFLGGSVRHVAHPVWLAVFLAVGTWGVVVASPPQRAWWRAWALVGGSFVLLQATLPMSQIYDGWRQRHAVHALVSTLPTPASTASGTVGAEVREIFSADLSGERWIEPITERPNVLLILLEGASGAALPSVARRAGIESSVAMPKLDAIARRHLLFPNVVAHQRQTNRGEYAILCGDYPKLTSDQSKMTEQVYGAARRCLPALLRDAGYRTVYVQAAPLGFMLKDQFMPKAGFDELVGDSSFAQSYARTDWGVDDKAFFEQALERIVALHSAEQPFFATLLTVGAHHPFTIPEGEALEGPAERRARAFRWTDEAIAGFIDALEQRGVLRDTIVILTSDESSGPVKTKEVAARVLAQSWSFAIVMLPEPQEARSDELVGHVDLALSVVDLLGIDARDAKLIGRSWFRRYEAPRRLFAGNTYQRRVIMWQPETTVICDETFERCKRHGRVKRSPFHPKRRGRAAAPRERRLLVEVARLTRSARPELTSSGAMKLLTSDEVVVGANEGKRLLTGGQYLRVPAGTVIEVELDLEIDGEDAEVSLHHDVFLDGRERFARKAVRLRRGERWRLHYELGVSRDSTQLVVQLYATPTSNGDAILRFREAKVTMRDAPHAERRVEIIEEGVSSR